MVSGWDSRSRRRNLEALPEGRAPGEGAGQEGAVWLGGEGAQVGTGIPRSTGVGEAGGKGFLSFERKS